MSHGNKNIKMAPKVREITFIGCPKHLNIVGVVGGVFQFHSISRCVINEIKFEDPKNGHLKKLQVVSLSTLKRAPQ
jgi:hypothetical protein